MFSAALAFQYRCDCCCMQLFPNTLPLGRVIHKSACRFHPLHKSKQEHKRAFAAICRSRNSSSDSSDRPSFKEYLECQQCALQADVAALKRKMGMVRERNRSPLGARDQQGVSGGCGCVWCRWDELPFGSSSSLLAKKDGDAEREVLKENSASRINAWLSSKRAETELRRLRREEEKVESRLVVIDRLIRLEERVYSGS